jgi:hypothetical protein
VVAVEFPDDLVITHFLSLEKRDPAPMTERTLPFAHGFEMPVHGLSEVESLKTKEVESPVHDPIGSVEELLALIGAGGVHPLDDRPIWKWEGKGRTEHAITWRAS